MRSASRCWRSRDGAWWRGNARWRRREGGVCQGGAPTVQLRDPHAVQPRRPAERRRRAGRGPGAEDRADEEGDAHAQRRRRRRPLRRRRGHAHAARRVDRHGARREHLRGGRQRQRQRPAVGEPHAHQPRARRPHPARLADAALDLRHADAGAGLGQHAGVQRQRPVDLRGRRAVQHRHRVQAVLSHDDTRLLDRAARSRARPPRRRPTTASSPTRPAPRPPTWPPRRRRTA